VSWYYGNAAAREARAASHPRFFILIPGVLFPPPITNLNFPFLVLF